MKKLNKKEKLELIQKYIDTVKATDKIIDKFSVFCQLNEDIVDDMFAYNSICEIMIDRILGKGAFDWISWYIYDNEYGENKFQAGYIDRTKEICNIEDLLEVIEGQK